MTRGHGDAGSSLAPSDTVSARGYRIVYEIDDAAMEVTIYKIDHRRDVYR